MTGACTHKRRRWRLLGFRMSDGLISQELSCVDCGAPLVRLNGKGRAGVEVAMSAEAVRQGVAAIEADHGYGKRGVHGVFTGTEDELRELTGAA